jgi:hypothetical protein
VLGDGAGIDRAALPRRVQQARGAGPVALRSVRK